MEKKKPKISFAKIIDGMCKVCEFVCVILLMVIFLSTTIQVFCRFILKNPLIWSEELSRYSGVWMVMLATCFTITRRSHMVIDLLVARFKPVVQRILVAASDVMILFVCCYMTYATWLMVDKFMSYKSITLGIPMGIVYTICMVGWICGIVSALYNVIVSVKAIPGGAEV